MSLVEDILKDDKTFTDEMELTLGDKKVSLGEIRKLSKSGQEKLATELAAAQYDRRSATELATKAADLVAKLEEAATRTAQPNRGETDEDDFETNNWWTPVRKRMTALEAQAKDAQKQAKEALESLTRAATIFAEDRWQREYDSSSDRLKKSKEYKEWGVDKVRDYAVQNKIVDRFGFPSVSKAIQEMMKADDLEVIRREEYERGLKEGQNKLRMASMTRPSSARGRAPEAGKTIDPTKNLEDLGDAVMDDPELTQMLADLGTLTPGDIQ